MLHELTHILLNPAHWFAEVVMDGTITLCIAYPVARLIKRHDRKVHGTPQEPKKAWEDRLMDKLQ